MEKDFKCTLLGSFFSPTLFNIFIIDSDKDVEITFNNQTGDVSHKAITRITESGFKKERLNLTRWNVIVKIGLHLGHNSNAQLRNGLLAKRDSGIFKWESAQDESITKKESGMTTKNTVRSNERGHNIASILVVLQRPEYRNWKLLRGVTRVKYKTELIYWWRGAGLAWGKKFHRL